MTEPLRTYTVVDLLDIKDSLGAHWDPGEKDSYEGECAGCGEAVVQSQDCCEFCGLPVIWKHSGVWRQLFGGHSIAERRLLSTPAERLGRQLCQRAGVERFPNPYALRRWKAALIRLDERAISGIIDYCEASLKRRNLGMRGLIGFVLNTTDQKIRTLVEEEPDEEEPGELDVEIYGGDKWAN